MSKGETICPWSEYSAIMDTRSRFKVTSPSESRSCSFLKGRSLRNLKVVPSLEGHPWEETLTLSHADTVPW